MNKSYAYFKTKYFDSLLEGQGLMLLELEKTFLEKLNVKDPSYFPTLVRMPTGTGKTGLIAIATYFGNESGSTLVLTPWRNLCTQLIDDFRSEFWKKINLTKEDQKQFIVDTYRIYPSKISGILKKKKDKHCVFVGTLNGLQNLKRNNQDIYNELREKISMVVVDEGHYEPAIRWGNAVKDLRRPTLVVTATPYRNDLKLFRVSSKDVFHYEHYKAVCAQKYPLRFITPTRLTSSSNEFSLQVNEFIRTWKSEFKDSLPNKTPRAIICCENKKRIMEAIELIHGAGISCMGFHERVDEDDFKNRPDLKKIFLKNVPNAKESSEEIWIHQNKLTEGLDDSRFCVLLLTYPFTNDRKLVQQVGRVLRHSDNYSHDIGNQQKAIVLFCSDYSFDEIWENYLNYEKLVELTTGDHYKNLIINYLALQPEYEYFGKRFRKRLMPFIFQSNNENDVKAESSVKSIIETTPPNNWEEEAWNKIFTPPSVLVLKVKDPINMDKFIEDTTVGISLKDSVILGDHNLERPIVYDLNKNIFLWIYAKIKNSDILINRSAYEISIETRFVHKVRDFLFIGDTGGATIEDFFENYGYFCTYFDLTKCIDETYIIKQASLFNTQSLNTAVRRTIRQGLSLEDAPYQISEKKYICQNLRAKRKGVKGDRYFGLTTGRISDTLTQSVKRDFNLKQLIDWTTEITKVLEDNTIQHHSFLKRYAKISEKPKVAEPYALILDPTPDPAVLQNEISVQSNTDEISIFWQQIDPKRDLDLNQTVFSFTKLSGGENEWDYSLNIEHIDEETESPIITNLLARYDFIKGSFQFKKGEITNMRVLYKNDVFNIEHFLNTRPDRYAITLRNEPLVYHNKLFFELDYSNAEDKFSTYFTRIPELKDVDFEKIPSKISQAQKKSLKQWPDNSVFKKTLNHVISKTNFGEYDFILCDDPNKEIADFLVISFQNRKIAFLHCKYGRGSVLSVSAFHDLTSQASKNLVYLRTSRMPPNIDTWNRKAFWEGTKIKRWIKGTDSYPEDTTLWDKIKMEILNHPNGKCEIWLVMGDGIDINILNKTIKSNSNNEEVGPLLHLLDGLVANCAEAAVSLRIFGH